VTSLLGLSTGCFSTASPEDLSGPAAIEEEPACITAEEAERMADQVLQLVNLERVAEKIAPVTVNDRLAKIAGDYACRMIEEEFFAHRDPINGHDPGDRAVAGKYAFYAVGENLAVGQQTPAEVMKEWMESPAHREAILDPTWTEVGIAVRLGGEYSVYWVQLFGHPADNDF
jgi:uncharacterized protein YkwD